MDFKLTSSGDLDLSTNDIQLVSGADYVAQNITIRLKFFLGEWFLDERLGVPWIQQVFRKGVPMGVVQNIIRTAILTTPGVLSVENLEYDLDTTTRRLSITNAAIKSTSGDITDFSSELVI